MCSNAKIEAAEPIETQRVSTALENNGTWLEGINTGFNHAFKKTHVGTIVNAVLQRHIEAKMLA